MLEDTGDSSPYFMGWAQDLSIEKSLISPFNHITELPRFVDAGVVHDNDQIRARKLVNVVKKSIDKTIELFCSIRVVLNSKMQYPIEREGSVRIAMILTQSWIPGRNPRVPYGCYPVQSLSPFPFRSQLPFRPLVRSLYLHPNSLCHICSLVSSIVFTCSPDLSLCALRFPSDFLWTHVSSPSSLFHLSSI